jgi:hypothetical protein
MLKNPVIELSKYAIIERPCTVVPVAGVASISKEFVFEYKELAEVIVPEEAPSYH